MCWVVFVGIIRRPKRGEYITEAQTILPFRSIKGMEWKVYHHLSWGENLHHMDVVKPPMVFWSRASLPPHCASMTSLPSNLLHMFLAQQAQFIQGIRQGLMFSQLQEHCWCQMFPTKYVSLPKHLPIFILNFPCLAEKGRRNASQALITRRVADSVELVVWIWSIGGREDGDLHHWWLLIPL